MPRYVFLCHWPSYVDMWLVYFGMCVYCLFMLLSGWTHCFSHPLTEHSQSTERQLDESTVTEINSRKPLPERRISGCPKKFHPCFVQAADTAIRCPLASVPRTVEVKQQAHLFPHKEESRVCICCGSFPFFFSLTFYLIQGPKWPY